MKAGGAERELLWMGFPGERKWLIFDTLALAVWYNKLMPRHLVSVMSLLAAVILLR